MVANNVGTNISEICNIILVIKKFRRPKNINNFFSDFNLNLIRIDLNNLSKFKGTIFLLC